MHMKCEYVDHMGSDLSVVNAARVSMDKQSEWDNNGCSQKCGLTNLCDKSCEELSQADTKLISYLAKHNHWTPFAHTAITLRMAAPVPIRTQCFKHKQGFVENEESRRYIKGKPELYVPDEFRMVADSVKQGSAGVHPKSSFVKEMYEDLCTQAINTYDYMIYSGVCPEQARFILPQGCLVNWIWTGSLAAYARVYKLRTDPHAQKEIQVLAEKIGSIIEPLFPTSWRALIASDKKALTGVNDG